MNLPKPSCPMGYTNEDLEELFPSKRGRIALARWMRGQTMGICNGSECSGNAHGIVVYRIDLINFFSGVKINEVD